MTITPKVLIAQQTVPNSQTSAYTSPPAAKGTWLDKFTVTNYSGTAVVVSVNLVTLGDTAGNQNLVIKQQSIDPGKVYTFPELIGKFLNPGDFVSWVSGTASALNGAANGRELT